MTSVEEANTLVEGLGRALHEMESWRSPVYKESEIEFRFETLVGILILAHADAVRLYQDWKDSA